LRTAPFFGIGPTLYVCEDCGYRGPVYLEEKNAPKKKPAGKLGSDTLLCTHCGYRNPSGFRYCGKCGSPLGNEETRVY
jgi:ribosomal protein L40E